MTILVDHRNAAFVVHRDDSDRAEVLDDLPRHDLPAGHPDIVLAQGENLSGMQSFGRYRLEDVLSHGQRVRARTTTRRPRRVVHFRSTAARESLPAVARLPCSRWPPRRNRQTTGADGSAGSSTLDAPGCRRRTDAPPAGIRRTPPRGRRGPTARISGRF